MKFIHVRDARKPNIVFTFAFEASTHYKNDINLGIAICREKHYNRKIGNDIAIRKMQKFPRGWSYDVGNFENISHYKLENNFEKYLKEKIIPEFIGSYYKNKTIKFLDKKTYIDDRFESGRLPKSGLWFIAKK